MSVYFDYLHNLLKKKNVKVFSPLKVLYHTLKDTLYLNLQQNRKYAFEI